MARGKGNGEQATGGKTMGNTVEIRWHGRGGQGAKTACLLLADAAFNSGKQVQGFPEYGPERMGAPITAYNRISEGGSGSSVHSNIYNPDFVVVVDETLLKSVDVTAGLSENGAIIVNSRKSPAEVRRQLRGYKGKVCTVDAGSISQETLGRNIPNTPMLAAAVEEYSEHSDAGGSRRGKPCHRQGQIPRGYGRFPSSQIRIQAAGRRRKYESAENVHEAAEGRLRQL